MTHHPFLARLVRRPRGLITAMALAVALLAMQPTTFADAAPTITVTTAADTGPGSLRAAIDAANLTAGKDTIKFNIPGMGPHTIVLASALPDITRPVVIDGTTQPTFARTMGILIDCQGVTCLRLDAGSTGSTIKGLALGGAVSGAFDGAAIAVLNSNNNVIQGNYLGTFDGTSSMPNNYGISIENSIGTVIGGTAAGQGNLVVFNDQAGIYLLNAGVSGTIIEGNRIGTNQLGAAAAGNRTGIQILNASNNVIGGTDANAGNLISGNTDGINIGSNIPGVLPEHNLIQGNVIGLNAAGTAVLPNAIGIHMSDAPETTIGGTVPGARNVISGNGQYGLDISATGGSAGSLVLGNFIGTDITGTLPLGNGLTGVRLIFAEGTQVIGNVVSANGESGVTTLGSDGTVIQGNFIGTDVTGTAALGNASTGVVIDNTLDAVVGGAATSQANVISNNGGQGVRVKIFGGSSAGTVVRGNAIGTDLSGALSMPNALNGISVENITDITIGGMLPGEGNRIAFNTMNGIAAQDSSNVTIAGNRIYNNAASGIALNSGTIDTNTMNCFDGNAAYGMVSSAGPTIAEMNWWGHGSGPTHASNPGGTGQPVDGAIDFDPWVFTSCNALLGERVSNGSMEIDAEPDGIPDGWTGTALTIGPTGDGRDCVFGGANLSACSFRFVGNNKAKKLAQTIITSGGAGEDITISVHTSQDSNLPAGGYFKATVTVFYVGGGKASRIVNLPTQVGGFALSVAPVLTTTRAYNKIEAKVEFKKSGGLVWIDDLSVVAVP